MNANVRAAHPGLRLASEFALFAATATAAIGLIRIFVGFGFLRVLVVAAVGSHLLAAMARRSRLPFVAALLLSLFGGAVTLGLMFYRPLSRFGLPTRATWNATFADIRAAISLFPSSVPPVVAEGGFFLVAAVAVWVLAFVADSLAFRARAGAEAVVPSAVLFIFGSALARGSYRVLCTLLWLAAALAFVVLRRTLREIQSSGWLSGHRRGASDAFVKGGVVLGGFAMLFGAFIGPRLPGAADRALVHTRNSGNSTVYAISPLVEIRKRVSSRSSAELFTVKSDVKAYWRVTALPDFDGGRWTSNLKQNSAKGVLGKPAAGIPQTDITAEFAISALSDLWVPTPYLPIAFTKASGKSKTKFDPGTATLILPSGLQRGDSYQILAKVPDVTPDVLRQASEAPIRTIDKSYLKLPSDYPTSLVDLAKEITAADPTTYDKALALQDWFRNEFTYDLSVAEGEGTGDIQAFIESRRGYCEQFSGTFAAFARSLGIPSRVAVGFTPGILKADGLYHVQALHAHAWPEVYFEGVGWMPFEPTPGRGNPTATQYTNVAGQQAGEDTPTPVAAAPTTTVVRNPNASTTAPFRLPKENTASDTPVAKKAKPFWPRYRTPVLVLVGLTLLTLYPWALRRVEHARWRRRRHKAEHASGKLRVSWHRTIDVLSRHDVAPEPGETPLAYAKRATGRLRIPDNLLPGLADAVTRATYADSEPDDAQLRHAERVPLQTTAFLEQRESFAQRWLSRIDPRPLFRSLPGDLPRRRRFAP